MEKYFRVSNPLIFLFVAVMLSSCANNSEEDIQPECTSTDLSIQISNIVLAGCSDPGSFTVEASGGTSPYQYSIDGTSFTNETTFSNLAAGNYAVTVKDSEGCSISTDFTLNSEGGSISLSIETSSSDCLNADGEIRVAATGGTGSLTYRLNDGATQSADVFSNLSPGRYSVSVTDEEGCSAVSAAQILSNASLQGDIMPIINTDCAISGCHNGSVSPNLTSKTAVIGNASRIKSETQARSMPRGRSLTQGEIDLIACWVDDGANDN